MSAGSSGRIAMRFAAKSERVPIWPLSHLTILESCSNLVLLSALSYQA